MPIEDNGSLSFVRERSRGKTRRRRSAAAALSLSGALLFGGCSDRRGGLQSATILTGEELAKRVPDVRSGSVKIWYADKSPAQGVYFVELEDSVPLQRLGGELRLLVLSGRMRIRVGAEEKVLGRGGYASIPARSPYRILREGREKLLYMAILRPDFPGRTALEGAGLLKRLARPPG